MTYCAIDFGTSNSAVALPDGRIDPAGAGRRRDTTLPTAVFFNTDEDNQAYGRAALEAYIDGFDGRLMRSMKSILGSPLAEQSTDLGDGSAIKYTDVITIFLAASEAKAQARRQRRRSRARCWAARCSSSTTIRAPTSMAQQQLEACGARDRPARDPLPVRADRSRVRLRIASDGRRAGAGRRHRRRYVGLFAGAGRAGTREACSSARTTCSPTTACTSRARISTGASNSATILRELGYQSIDPEGREIAEPRLFRSRDVASDQHGLRAETRQRTAADAASLHRRRAITTG